MTAPTDSRPLRKADAAGLEGNLDELLKILGRLPPIKAEALMAEGGLNDNDDKKQVRLLLTDIDAQLWAVNLIAPRTRSESSLVESINDALLEKFVEVICQPVGLYFGDYIAGMAVNNLGAALALCDNAATDQKAVGHLIGRVKEASDVHASGADKQVFAALEMIVQKRGGNAAGVVLDFFHEAAFPATLHNAREGAVHLCALKALENLLGDTKAMQQVHAACENYAMGVFKAAKEAFCQRHEDGGGNTGNGACLNVTGVLVAAISAKPELVSPHFAEKVQAFAGQRDNWDATAVLNAIKAKRPDLVAVNASPADLRAA